MKPAHYSIIIPARNEEQHLPLCLKAIEVAAARVSAQIEIIVVVNRCTDRTEEIAREHGCTVVHSNAKNLSVIRNCGASAASGDVLLTIDADSRMCAHMLQQIERCMTSRRSVGGGTLIFPERLSIGIALTFICLIPIALIWRISGGLYFCRRDAFEAIGGFNEKLVSVEDIDFARRLRSYARANNLNFINLYNCWITTSTRKFDTLGDWYFLRNPALIKRLFTGTDQESANKIWYDFKR